MSIQTVNTIEELYNDIGKFLQGVYSQEELVKTYNDALKKAHSIHVIYSALPDVPFHNNKPLDGLQSIRKWCEEAEKAVDDIVSNLKRQTIDKMISQFKRLRGFANKVFSLVDKKLQNEIIAEYTKKRAQEEARIQAEKDKRFLAKQKTGDVVSPLLLRAQINADIVEKIGFASPKESKGNAAVQSYLSKDPAFNDKLSQLKNEINKVFGEIKKLASNNTPDVELVEIYCELKDIPLQQQCDEIEYVYSFQNLADVILDNCNRLYSSVDNVIETLENIQTKVEQKIQGSDVEDTNTEVEQKKTGTQIEDSTPIEIPPDQRTLEMSKKELAELFGGNMTPEKITKRIEKGLLNVIKINRQTFIFDKRNLPADVIEKLTNLK